MWNRLKQADLEQAKRLLDRRRDEALRKHEEEMRTLATDQAAIASLHEMVSALARKLNTLPPAAEAKPAPIPPAAPPSAIDASAIIAPPAPAKSPITVRPATEIRPLDHRAPHRHPGAEKHAAKGRHSERRDHRTNFETYLHAMAKNERGWR